MVTVQSSKPFPRRKFIILILQEPEPRPDTPLPPFTVTTRDGHVLTTIEEVTEHLLQADRLSDAAMEQLLRNLGDDI